MTSRSLSVNFPQRSLTALSSVSICLSSEQKSAQGPMPLPIRGCYVGISSVKPAVAMSATAQIRSKFTQVFLRISRPNFLDHKGDQPGDEKIPKRMDKQGDGRRPRCDSRRSRESEGVQMVSRIAQVSRRAER